MKVGWQGKEQLLCELYMAPCAHGDVNAQQAKGALVVGEGGHGLPDFLLNNIYINAYNIKYNIFTKNICEIFFFLLFNILQIYLYNFFIYKSLLFGELFPQIGI